MADTNTLQHSLFLQLQTRYPGAALVTELVQSDKESYLVRALVQMGGTSLATGMAAAPTIEQAEDRARLRVLGLLGVGVASPAPPTPTPLGYENQPPLPPTPPIISSELTPSQPPSFIPDPAVAASLTPNGGFQAASIPPLPLPPPPSLEPSPPKSLKPKKSIPEPIQDEPIYPAETEIAELPDPLEAPESVSSDAFPDFAAIDDEPDSLPEPMDEEMLGDPVDLSELIAFTDVEMERIGWSKKRGQSHLKRTYGRQTRAELNEEQLLEFLHFLRALPSQRGGEDE